LAAALTNDRVLARFRNVLDEVYGDSLERMVLLGDAHGECDYDVAVFMHAMARAA
jgi:hypothetical protein